MKKALLVAGVLAVALMAYSFAQDAAQPAQPAQPSEQAPAAPAPQPAAEPQPDQPAVPGALPTTMERASYAIGYNIGRNLAQGFKSEDIDINIDMLVTGMRDALAGAQPPVSDADLQQALTELQQTVMQQRQEKLQKESAENIEKGKAFLEQNKAKEGVITLPSGLQYEVITEGAGEDIDAGDTINVNYTGTLLNGEVFDASERRGGPATFTVGELVAGMDEALAMMKVGSKWRLYIPSDLAYGAQGRPPVIGPNALLIFDIEILSKEAPELESTAPEAAGEGQNP